LMNRFISKRKLSTRKRKKKTLNVPLGGTTKHKFKTFTFRNIELDELVKISDEDFSKIITTKPRRRMLRGLKEGCSKLIKKIRRSKKAAPFGEKPATVKTHIRDMVVLPEMIGSVVGVYNGRDFVSVEIKEDMVGHFVGEFSLTYHPVNHGRPGVGATSSSKKKRRKL